MLPGGVVVNSVQFEMESWTGAQRAFAVKSFYKNNDSYVATQREFRKKFGIHRKSKVPSAHAIKAWVNNFEETGSTVKKIGGNVKTVRTPQNIDAVRASFEQSPGLSAVRHSKKLGLSEMSVRHILHLDLHFHPYKIQVVQKLEEGDAAKRLVFSQQMLDLINEQRSSQQSIHERRGTFSSDRLSEQAELPTMV